MLLIPIFSQGHYCYSHITARLHRSLLRRRKIIHIIVREDPGQVDRAEIAEVDKEGNVGGNEG